MRPAPFPPLASPPDGLESYDLTVLEAVMGQDEPATMRRIAKLTAMPAGQIAPILDSLCTLGLLRRLNTVVESYTARFR